MNKYFSQRAVLSLTAMLIAASCVSGFSALIIRGGQQIQVQGNGVLMFNQPTVVNELPDVAVPSGSTTDALLFSNGDFLYGKLVSIDPQRSVRWQHPDARQPIDFKSTNVTQIDLSNGRRTLEESNNCKIDFINNDGIKASLISCDKDNVVVDTAYAGRLKLSRATLESLVMVPPLQPVLFEGPTGIEGWTPGKAAAAAAMGDAGEWKYRNGAFYANKAASIARDVHLPDTAQIEFDLVWKDVLNVAIALYTDSLQPVSLAAKESAPDFGGFYSFQVHSSYMQMMPIKKNDPLRELGGIAVPALMKRDRAHFDLRVSKQDRKIALLINGLLVKEWIDSEGFAGKGTMMRFVHQGQGGAVKISNIRVRPWDGQLEEASPTQAHRVNDSVRLADGSRLTGTIEKIADGKLAIATGTSTIQVALSKLRQIDFASQNVPAAQTNSQPVRVLLTPGYTVSGYLESWTADAMTLKSPEFGEAKFDPKAVSRLQFAHD